MVGDMRHTDPAHLRTVILRPYRKGMGPAFRLTTWDTNRCDHYGKSILRYQLDILPGGPAVELFSGSDFACSPMHAIDSDRALASLLTFLTLRPGDTDREYFDAYTPEQMAYANEHAETLAGYVTDRFGEY